MFKIKRLTYKKYYGKNGTMYNFTINIKNIAENDKT